MVNDVTLALLTAVEQEHEKVLRLMAMCSASSAIYLLNKRSIWAAKRSGTFWEKDVPSLSAEMFKECFRCEAHTFNLLVQRLPGLCKKDTPFRSAIPLRKRIAVALYTLGSTAEYQTIGNLFGISKTMVCKILHEFCNEVIAKMAGDYLPPVFLTEKKLKECVKGFEELGFPQCFGAMGGCHIEVKPKADGAKDYRNYKGWYSTVLFALVDYRHRFLYMNVGCPGSCHDAKIYAASKLETMLDETPLFRDNARVLCETEVPVVVLGYSALPFSKNIMKPFPFSMNYTAEERAFNYNLSKARYVVENAFVQLKARFQRIGKGLDNNTTKTSNIIVCCCILHNFLNENNSHINEKWQRDAVGEREQPERHTWQGSLDKQAAAIRQAFSKYFVNN